MQQLVGDQLNMSDVSFEKGDRVRYHPTGSTQVTTVGTIVDIITNDKQVGIQKVHASEERPRYVVRNEHTGKETAYYLENIIDIVEEHE